MLEINFVDISGFPPTYCLGGEYIGHFIL